MKHAKLLILAFTAALIFGSLQTVNAADMAPRKLSFGTQSVGTTQYNRNAAMANVMNEHLPQGWEIEMVPSSPGGMAATVLVDSGKYDMAEGANVSNHMLRAGTAELGGKKMPVPKRAKSFLAGIDFGYFTVFMREDFRNKAGVDTIEELIEKKIPFNLVTKAPASAGEMGASLLLKSLGVTYDDIKKWGGNVYNLSPAQMADMLREGKADVSIDIISPGQPAMTELTMTNPMYLPQLGEKTLQALNKIGYAPKVLKADSWKGQDRDLNTMVSASAYVVNGDLPDDVVYAMTKALVENKPDLVKQVPAMEQFVPENSGDDSINGLDLHPGALKYYKEKGLIK